MLVSGELISHTAIMMMRSHRKKRHLALGGVLAEIFGPKENAEFIGMTNVNRSEKYWIGGTFFNGDVKSQKNPASTL